MWRMAFDILLGVFVILMGLALAADYRGIATKHIEMSSRTVRPVSLSRRIPWEDDRLVRRRARFVILDRILGVLMILAGAAVLITAGAS